MERYENNPFLRLVGSYLLDLIGELKPEQLAALSQLEPKLQRTFKMSGSWQEMIEHQMDFMPSVRDKVRAFWAGYQKAASDQGLPAVPDDFVISFVNQNFPHLVGDQEIH